MLPKLGHGKDKTPPKSLPRINVDVIDIRRHSDKQNQMAIGDEKLHKSGSASSVSVSDLSEEDTQDNTETDNIKNQSNPLDKTSPLSNSSKSTRHISNSCDSVSDLSQEDGENESRSMGVVEMTLNNISKFSEWPKDKKVTSEPIIIRCLPWRILVMCRSDSSQTSTYKPYPTTPPMHLGYFIQCNSENNSNAWTCHAKAQLCLVARVKGCENIEKSIEHTFYAKENDWGFVNFISLKDLLNEEKGFVENDSILLRVTVRADAPHGAGWNSKKYTGFVGIKNQGATCYMNSLLQALYFTNKLRKAVYQMPTEMDEKVEIPLSLQWLFYDLQHSKECVDTKRLTRSFGWESSDSFMQHDVQELCRVLLENLERKMEGTIVGDTIPNLFCGRMLSYVRCKHVSLVSEREENFYDIQLKVKDNRSIYNAFEDYIAVETLDQDNLYNAGEHGMQEAEKGVLFLRFPPVLYLQLMRFQYDPEADANVKINDRFEFPYKLDLDPYLKKKEDQPAHFFLHAVLVHSGDNHGGHYIVYINPRGDNKWFKFDDDVVSSCTRNEAIEQNYGGGAGNTIDDKDFSGSRYSSNAYMLVYIRESAKEDVLAPLTDNDIPLWMRKKFSEKQREIEEAHQQTRVSVILEDDFQMWQGYYLYGHFPLRTLRYSRNAKYQEFLRSLADYIHVGLHFVRPWLLKPKRQTQKRCFFQPLTENLFLNEEFREIWLEILPSTINTTFNPTVSNDECLLFVKYYDLVKDQLTYLGHTVAPRKSLLSKILEPFRENLQPSFKESEMQVYFENDSQTDVLFVRNPQSKLDDCLQHCNLPVKEHGHVVVFYPSSKSQNSLSSLIKSSSNTALSQRLTSYYTNSVFKVLVLFLDRQAVVESIKNGGNNSNNSLSSTTNNELLTSHNNDGIMTDQTLSVSQHRIATSEVATLKELTDEFGCFYETVNVNMTYWQVVEVVAKRISQLGNHSTVSAERIQLFVVSQSCDTPIPSESTRNFQDILFSSWNNTLSVGRQITLFLDTNATSPSYKTAYDANIDPNPRQSRLVIPHRLYYKVLPNATTIKEIESLQHVRIYYVPINLREEIEINLSLSPRATLNDLLNHVSSHRMVQLNETTRKDLRLWEVLQNRLQMEITDLGQDISKFMLTFRHKGGGRYLRVDHRPEEEKKIAANESIIKVAHYHKDVLTGMHGIPFTMLVRENDTLRTLSERIRLKCEVSVKEFAKWNVALYFNTQSQNVKMDENLLLNMRYYQQSDQLPTSSSRLWIGLNHRSNSKRTVEKAIKIRD